jgi:hypothetical protein
MRSASNCARDATIGRAVLTVLDWDHNAYYHRLLLRQLPQKCNRVLDVGAERDRSQLGWPNELIRLMPSTAQRR